MDDLKSFHVAPLALMLGFCSGLIGGLQPQLFLIVIEIKTYSRVFTISARSVAHGFRIRG
jgi:hypothetical protein